MKLSERMERLFSYAKSTWKDPPPCPFNRDFQYAAVNLFSDKEVWERAALSFAYALRRAPVIIHRRRPNHRPRLSVRLPNRIAMT